MPTLKEILADRTKYADTVLFDLGDGNKVTLGDLRALDGETRSAVVAQQETVRKQQQQLLDDLQTLQRAQANAADLYAKAEEVLAAHRGTVTPPANDPFASLSQYENDPVFRPLVSVIKVLSDELKTIQGQTLKSINDNIRGMAATYIQDHLEERYERVVPADQREKFPMQTLIQVATTKGYETRNKLPDIGRAFKDLSAPTPADVKAQEQKTREEIAKEERDKLVRELAVQGIHVPRPGVGAGATSGPTKVFGSLDEAIEAAKKDAEIWKLVDQSVPIQ